MEPFGDIGHIWFEKDHALIPKDTINSLVSNAPPMSFKQTIDHIVKARIFPSDVNWNPGMPELRNISLSGVKYECFEIKAATLGTWREVSEQIGALKGNDYIAEHLFGTSQYKNIDSYPTWRDLTYANSFEADFSHCNTHLTATLQIRGFKEIYLDSWQFNVSEKVDPAFVATCQ